MNLIQYVETIEVVIDSISKEKFYFGEQPSLREKIIIYCLSNPTALSKAPSGKGPVNSTARAKAYIVLVAKGNEVINRYPVNFMEQHHHFPNPLEINRVIDWPKCYIEVAETTGLVVNEVFLLTFYCMDRRRPAPKSISLCTEVIEVKTTPATQLRYFMPDNENLRNKVIHHIEYCWDAVQKSPSNASFVNNTAKQKTYLTIFSEGVEIIKQMPLVNLAVGSFEGWKFPFSFKMDLSKSFFEIPDTADLVENEAYVLFFFYF